MNIQGRLSVKTSMAKNRNARTALGAFLAVCLTAVGCAPGSSASNSSTTEPANANGAEAPTSANSVADPVREGAELPDGFLQVFPRDAIEPIYNPKHVSADQIDWDDDTLIIGARVNDESRAYPVDFLNRHEIVNDTLDGLPVLVTW